MSQLIGQGGYGCIFYPGFNCKGNYTSKTKNIVTKLQVKDFNAKNEILIGKKIMIIPNFQLYFIPVISYCSINIAQLNSEYIDKCDIVSSDNPNYLLLKLPYIENISFNELFYDSSKLKNKHLFLIYIESYEYLTISISKLIKERIVHFDIKEQNILYSVKYKNPILIDYGISIPFDLLNKSNIKDYFYTYGPDYSLWSLEIHTINFLLHKNDIITINDINSMVEIYIENNRVLNIFSDSFKNNYSFMCKQFLGKFINKDKGWVISELLKFWSTWDLYSLSILYIKLLNTIFTNGFIENKLVNQFLKILLLNISPDPNKRLSIDNTLKKYRDLFFINEKLENYLTLIDNLNYTK